MSFQENCSSDPAPKCCSDSSVGVHHRFDVERSQRSLRRLVLEEDVGDRRDDVQVLAVPEVDEESKDQGEVGPEEEPVEDHQRLAPGPERAEDARQR